MRAALLILLLGATLAPCDYSTSTKGLPAAQTPGINPSSTPLASKAADRTILKLDKTVVWTGSISAADVTEQDQVNAVWANEDLKLPDFNKPGVVIQVDVLNCGGFIVSGRLSKNDRGETRLEIEPDTAASDAVEKIKQCDASPQTEMRFTSSSAFAIAPQSEQRRNIKIGPINTKKLFASLPAETQKILKNKNGYDIHKKSDFSLEHDSWADSDGDGKIDLVKVSSMYDVEHSFVEVLMLINGKWNSVGGSRD